MSATWRKSSLGISDMKPTFVVYGNCQAGVLQDIINAVPFFEENYETIYYQSFDHPTEGLSTISPDVMSRCAILWRQSDDNLPFTFDGTTPEAMKTVTFPSVDLGILWPQQMNDPLFTREDRYPYGMFPYGDRLLIEVAKRGLSGEAGKARLAELWSNPPFPFDRYLDIELQRLMRREQATQIKMAAYVLSRFRTDRLLWSYNHPTSRLFAVLLNRLIAATFPDSRELSHPLYRLGDHLFREYDPFASSYQAPIFQPVAEALDLQWWSPDDTYYFHDGERLSCDQFIERYLDNRIARQGATAVLPA
jgi:Polysaccharide biosynthesis enzyme WcbI